MVNELFGGEYHSVFKGRGIEFAEVREYFPGDDIRAIDWNVTARMGHPFVKVFEEERELTVQILVDASASQGFGTRQRMKRNLAAEISALLAFAAVKNNDKVGLTIFTDQIEKFIPPHKGTTHVLHVIREILSFQPQGRQTNLAGALEHLMRVQHRQAIVFLLSDFLDVGYEKALKIAARRHDLIGINLVDPWERELPALGWLQVHDAETGELILLPTGSVKYREQYRQAAETHRQSVRDLFRRIDLDYLELNTNEDYAERLIRFFRNRARRIRMQ